MRTYGDFIKDSVALIEGDKWIVYVDGESMRGAIYDCVGNTEFEAKENAWNYYCELTGQINDKKNPPSPPNQLKGE